MAVTDDYPPDDGMIHYPGSLLGRALKWLSCLGRHDNKPFPQDCEHSSHWHTERCRRCGRLERVRNA